MNFKLLVAALLLSYSSGFSQSSFKVLKEIKVPGDGKWDYCAFDSVNRVLYISHDTMVQALDVDKGIVVGTIPHTKGVHGIAIAYDLNKGFTSNGKDSSVTVFDLKTFKVLRVIHIPGANPDCILYDPFMQRVFTFNGKSKDATVINANSFTIAGKIALGGKPEFAATDKRGRVFVNLEDSGQLLVIDAKAMTVTVRWSVGPGEEPSGLSYDDTYDRLFIGCGNKMMIVMNPHNGKVVQRYAIGDGVDATAFNHTTKTVFASCGEGVLTIATQGNANKYSNIENVPTRKGARTMAVDTKLNRVYMPAAQYGPPVTKKDGTKGKPSVLPDSFVILVVGKE